MHNWKELIRQNALPLLLVLGVVAFFIYKQVTSQPQVQAPVVAVSKTSQTLQNTEEQPVKSETGKITVDVKGAVHNPGVYELSSPARAQTAIQKAGGLTSEADPNGLNLAQLLKDEAVVYVPREGEVPTIASAASVGGKAVGSSDSGKIALNQASAEDLQKIPGIGKKRAEDILAFRDQNGGFQSIDDLKKVSGIGEKTLEKIKDHVQVD
ncbi:helix-hairpin-helix domain-containing protein [Streptococcus sp. 121]|uniref:helix-hairpin-helix domain-containing protein n=1 Tax=Streptococcus sp. 121 TaxID=2797637 RepID=UPI0018F107CF|nr:helix-hairpin-helix domain-containing protein [Streptococcus sp. 121]MBJ6745438.1 helix-hairpin-helix domain-containing protein [Streptococcus sp. 121]